MSHTDTHELAARLGLTIDPHTVIMRAGDWSDTSWKTETDADSGLPAIATVIWATVDGQHTEEAFDYEHLVAHLDYLDASGEYDTDHGIHVTISPWWLHYTQTIAA